MLDVIVGWFIVQIFRMKLVENQSFCVFPERLNDFFEGKIAYIYVREAELSPVRSTEAAAGISYKFTIRLFFPLDFLQHSA